MLNRKTSAVLYGICIGFLSLGAILFLRFNNSWGVLLAAISVLFLVLIQHRLERAVRPTAEVAFASIRPYLEIALYLRKGLWDQIVSDTLLKLGRTYYIKVTQDCILSYDGFSFELVEGWNWLKWPYKVGHYIPGMGLYGKVGN